MSRNDAFLTVFAAILVLFSLAVSLWVPKRNPGFPGRSLKLFAAVSVALVIAMLAAVEVFGEAHHFGEAGGEGDQPSETEPAPGPEGGEGEGGGEGDGGEGGEDGEQAALGQQVFNEAGCGGCHVLEAAGSTGTIGPNLDESDVPLEAAVEQIRAGGNGMPAFEGRLSDEQIEAVAAYVTGE